MIRNGQLFYIKGGAAEPGFLAELKIAGGNNARIYDTAHLGKTSDKAYELGVTVVVDIFLFKIQEDPNFEKRGSFLRVCRKG